MNQGFVSGRGGVIPEMSDQQTLNHYGELEGQHRTIDAGAKKKAGKGRNEDQAIKLSLQPKLINPPSKLTKTLDHQQVRGAHQVKKRQPPM